MSTTSHGRPQRIEVVFTDGPNKRPYCYETDLRVMVGDVVEVPGNWYSRRARPGWPNMAKVTSLSSDYGGEVQLVLRVCANTERPGT